MSPGATLAMVAADQSADRERKEAPKEGEAVDDAWSAAIGFSGVNLCVVCGVDLGDCNPRQLCRKLFCDGPPPPAPRTK